MNYQDLVRDVERLPNVGPDFVGYLVNLVRAGSPSPAFVTLMPQHDGSWTATLGDLRERVESATDESGNPLRFPSEDAACRWAYEKIRAARQNIGSSPANRESAMKDAEEISRRIAELDRQQGVANDE